MTYLMHAVIHTELKRESALLEYSSVDYLWIINSAATIFSAQQGLHSGT